MARHVSYKSRQKWDAIIERLNRTKTGRTTVVMGSPGSAQVTRVRLLQNYRNLRAWTEKNLLRLEVE